VKLFGPTGDELGTTELTDEAEILAWAKPLLEEAAAEAEAAWRAMLAKAPAEWTKAEAAMWKAAWKAEAEVKFQAAHDRAEKQLANNRRIFHDR